MSHPVMPSLDAATLGRRSEIVAALREIVPDGVIDSPIGMKPYESDGLTAYRTVPLVVVLPETVEQVSAVLRGVMRATSRSFRAAREPRCLAERFRSPTAC